MKKERYEYVHMIQKSMKMIHGTTDRIHRRTLGFGEKVCNNWFGERKRMAHNNGCKREKNV